MATTHFRPRPQAPSAPTNSRGRVALVTGGTRGIGAAICHSLASAGAVVGAGYSSNQARADELRDAVETDGGTLTLHQGNVGDSDDCQRVVQEVIDQHGRLDILVNNAGVTVDRPVWKMCVDDWHKVLRVNLSGAFYMSKPAIVHMLERGSRTHHQHLHRSPARSATSAKPTTPPRRPGCSGSPRPSPARPPSPSGCRASSTTASA